MTLSTFSHNQSDIRFDLKDLRGGKWLDIRVWAPLHGREGKVATGQGVTIALADIEAFKKAFLEAECALKEKGFLS
ncbi:MAG: hypothetical protein HY592_02910 [Candidatus Omnitrophica bacterium]|nr:hypothetical protein [Candidatus Omnitrophota bacterium]